MTPGIHHMEFETESAEIELSYRSVEGLISSTNITFLFYIRKLRHHAADQNLN